MRRFLLLAAGLLVLAGCSNPQLGDGAEVPNADVVAAVKPSPTLAARVPSGQRTIGFGTTEQPGTSGLPYVGTRGDEVVGLQVDLANAVARVLGVRAEREVGTFPTIVPGVQNGKYDVGLANLGVTRERLQVVDFATYLDDGQAFLGSRNVSLDRVRRLTDVCGLTIATAPGSTFQQLLTEGRQDCVKAGKPPYVVQYFATPAPIVLGLSSGKIDAEFGPTLSMKYDAEHIPGTKFLGQLTKSPVGFVTRKGSVMAPLLRDAVNALIAGGDYARILAKWGVTSSAVPRSQVNPKPAF